MHFNDLKRVLPAYLMSGVSLELRSAPGRGKSTFIEDMVDAMSARTSSEWGFATLFLATQTPPDLLGYMFKGELDYEGKKIAVTDPTLPPWMVTRSGKPVWAYKNGILCLDEYGQGQADVKAAAAELLLNHRIGKWVLPEGWSVIACSNRTTDRSGVTKALDFVINRRGEIDITDDFQSWEDWAFSVGLDPLFIAYAGSHIAEVFTEGVPEKQGPWCTPRSLHLVSKVLDQMRDENGKLPTDALAIEVASGIVGKPVAASLFSHIRLGHEMPDLKDIEADPKKCKVPAKPDAQMLVTYQLAAKVTEKNADALITYMERMPKEFSITFAKAAVKRDGTLIYCDAVTEWCNRNASLMTALTDHSK